MLTIQIGAGDKVRLYCDDAKMTAILDAWAKGHGKKDGFPCAGYSAKFAADAYDLEPAQLLEFLAARLGGTGASQTAQPAATHRTKQPISEAQRAARRENARKARERRYRAV